MKTKRIPAALLAAVLALSLTACTRGEILREQGGDHAYLLAFSGWSGEQTHALHLAAGEELWVEAVREGGRIGLSIESGDGEAVYIGSSVPEGGFSVTVREAGLYIVTVTGNRASGQVSVTGEE